jgi:hypothetical protein
MQVRGLIRTLVICEITAKNPRRAGQAPRLQQQERDQ